MHPHKFLRMPTWPFWLGLARLFMQLRWLALDGFGVVLALAGFLLDCFG